MSVEISVILPVYGVEKYIEHTMKSLLAQTYRNFEIILVDDETPDESIEVATSVLAQGDIPYKVVSQKNAGVGQARNRGMLASQGQWVYFLDSDDVILPCTLEHMRKEAETNQAELVFCDFHKTSDYNVLSELDGTEKSEVLSGQVIQEEFLKRRKIVLAPGTLYRRGFLKKNNLMFHKVPWSEDQHFIWRVLSYAQKAVYMKAPYYQYYQRPGSIMSYTSQEKMIESYSYVSELPKYYEKNAYVEKYLVPRWVMGTVNSAAVMYTYSEWKELCGSLEAKKNFNALLKFDDVRVRVLALIGYILPKLYYGIARKRLHK